MKYKKILNKRDINSNYIITIVYGYDENSNNNNNNNNNFTITGMFMRT